LRRLRIFGIAGRDSLKSVEGEEVPPWFVGMSELAHYVVESYAKGVTVEFGNLFSSVEALLQNSDPEIENLIAVGLFEDIQNIASHRDFGAVPFRQLLGLRSLVVWDEVDACIKRVAAWQHGINLDGGNSGDVVVFLMPSRR